MIDYAPGTALVVVDVQNDFADPDGSLYVPGGEAVVPVANRAVAEAEAAGAPVIYTQDWHPESTPHFEKDGGIWPVHCVRGTWGAGFHPDLDVRGPVVQKGTDGRDGYSGFTVRDPESGDTDPTALESLLRQRDVRRIVITGLATDYCVKETALDGLRKGFEVAVIEEGARPVDLQEGDGARALDEMASAGAQIV